MKKFLFVIAVGLCLLCGEAYGQEYIEPQWKFYFAFEDATGARDTIWIVLDQDIPSGNFGNNMDYGEVPYILNDSLFNVYVGLGWMTVTKLRAFNINHPPDLQIHGMNAVLPMTLSWDTALFNAPVLQATEAGPICNPRLDSDYFFGFNNAPWLHHQHSMLLDSSVLMPEFNWFSQNHFPLTVYFDRGYCNFLDVDEANIAGQVKLYPNPCIDFLVISTDLILEEIQVYNLQGNVVLQESTATLTSVNDERRLDVHTLPHGMYFLQAIALDGRKWVIKFIKGN